MLNEACKGKGEGDLQTVNFTACKMGCKTDKETGFENTLYDMPNGTKCGLFGEREESGSAPLPGVAASTRRRATCSVNNGSDGRAPILNAKAKPCRVDKKGRRRKDVTFAKAYRNNTSAATELIRRAAVPHCCADSMSASLSWERVR
ncbi:hypothetical protein ISCGN_024545 [Ixodes scapularis]